MKIYVQWSTTTAKDWIETDSLEWGLLPFRPLPVGGEILDERPGWISAICVMGTVWAGYDHYACEHLGDGRMKVYAWIDDDADLVSEAYDKYARVMTLWPLGEDRAMGNAINTRGEEIVFAQQKTSDLLDAIGPVQNKTLRPASEFVEPDASLVGHGIWLPDALNTDHEKARRSISWKEWSEGVAGELVDESGRVKAQRPLGRYDVPDGTKTFLLRGTDQASGIHATSDSTFENEMTEGGTPAETAESENLGGGDSELTHLWSTVSGVPNDAAWPTGDYRCILDASNVGADITFGLDTAGAADGHFARVNTGLTSDLETKTQTEGLFGTPAGLKTATTGSVSWTAGNASDRFECLVAATRAANHGNQPLEMAYDGDGFADGPWVVAATAGHGQLISENRNKTVLNL